MQTKPLSVLSAYINKQVMVEMKAGKSYRGVLDGYDPHMNLVLKSAEEFDAGVLKAKYDLAIVRGDNVIYVSP